MKRLSPLLRFILAAATLFGGAASGLGSDAERKAVQKASDRFYAALNAMFTGDLKPMEAVWSHKDDVTYLDPTGAFHLGWDKVRASWRAQAEQKLGGKVAPSRLEMTVGTDLAVTQTIETGENLDPEGQPLKVSIRATHVFRKEDGRWMMIGCHADLLPFLKKPAPSSP